MLGLWDPIAVVAKLRGPMVNSFCQWDNKIDNHGQLNGENEEQAHLSSHNIIMT